MRLPTFAFFLPALLLASPEPAAASETAPAPLVFATPSAPGAATHVVLARAGDDLELRDAATGRVLARRPMAATSRVVVRGASGDHDDTLTVDLSGGPIEVPGGVDYDGGARGWDVLEIRGGSVDRERHLHRGPDAGTIDLDALEIRYANLEPITDSVPSANYTVTATVAATAISVTDGAAGTTRVTMTGAESIDFSNKTNVTIAGANVDTAWTVNNPNAATGLVTLTLNGGTGNDTFGITPSATVPYAVNGGDPVPPASPGDTLDVILSGVTSPSLTSTPSASGYFGTWTFGNRATITFSQLEGSPTPVELQRFRAD